MTTSSAPMAPSQADQLDDAAPPEALDRLWLALRPPEQVVADIGQLTARLRSAQGLSDPAVAPGQLQLTLHDLGEHAGLRADIVRAAREAAATVRVPPFALRLDRVLSFKARAATAPLVLAAAERSDDVAALKAFNLVLGQALMRVRLGRWLKSDFKPHVTLLHSAQHLPVQPVEPIGWAAGEFVLLHHPAGQGEPTVLGRWPLRA